MKRTTIFFVTALFIGSSFVSPVLTTEETNFAKTCKNAALITVFSVASLYSVLRLSENYQYETRPLNDLLPEGLHDDHNLCFSEHHNNYARLADWGAAGTVLYGLGSWAYNKIWNNKKDDQTKNTSKNNSSSKE